MSQTNEKGFFFQRIRLRTLINFREKQDPQRRRNTNGETALNKNIIGIMVNEHIKNAQSC